MYKDYTDFDLFDRISGSKVLMVRRTEGDTAHTCSLVNMTRYNLK